MEPRFPKTQLQNVASDRVFCSVSMRIFHLRSFVFFGKALVHALQRKCLILPGILNFQRLLQNLIIESLFEAEAESKPSSSHKILYLVFTVYSPELSHSHHRQSACLTDLSGIAFIFTCFEGKEGGINNLTILGSQVIINQGRNNSIPMKVQTWGYNLSTSFKRGPPIFKSYDLISIPHPLSSTH